MGKHDIATGTNDLEIVSLCKLIHKLQSKNETPFHKTSLQTQRFDVFIILNNMRLMTSSKIWMNMLIQTPSKHDRK